MIEVEGINISIAGDASKFEAAVKRVEQRMREMERGVNANATNLSNGFTRITQSAQRFSAALLNMGLPVTNENLRVLKQSYKEIEQEQNKAAANEKKIQDAMYKWRTALRKQEERDNKNHLKAVEKANREARKEQEKAEHAQSTIANKSALYGGLISGTMVGGRFGFASGFFGGRVGTAIGGALGGAGSGLAIAGGVAGAGAGLALAAGAKILVAYLETAYALMEKIGGAAYSFLTTSLKLGLEHEKQITSLRIMSGGKEKGDKLYGQIEKIAIDSPYRTTELLKQGEILLGSGVSPENLPAYLSRIGDMSGGNMNRFHLIAKAMADVKAVGHLRGQELNQFANQGYGAAFFAKNLGMEPEVFKRKMSQNEITADKVAGAINNATDKGGQLYGKSKEIATTTVGGALESIGETIESFQKKFGEMLLKKFNVAEILNKFLRALESIDMKKIEQWVDRGIEAFKPLGKTFIEFGDYIVKFAQTLWSALPSWNEFASVITENVKVFIPMFIDAIRLVSVMTAVAAKTILFFANSAISILNGLISFSTLGTKPILEKITNTKLTIPQIQGIDKMQKSLNGFIGGVVGSGSFRPSSRNGGGDKNGFFTDLINGKHSNRNGVDPDKINERGPRFDKETQDLAEKVSKEVKEGVHPFQKFDIGMKRLIQAAKPSDGGAPLIGKDAFGVGAVQFMHSLENDMKGFMDKQPHTAAYATSDAQSIINANITMNQMNVQERTLATIEAAKIVLENQLKAEQEILKALKKSYSLNDNGL